MKNIKSVFIIFLAGMMLLLFAGCSSGPSADVQRQVKKLKTCEDLIKKGTSISGLVLGMDQDEIDTEVFDFSDTYKGTGSFRLTDYGSVDGKDLDVTLNCEDQKVVSVKFWLLGGGGFTPEEYGKIIDYAIAEFGEDYTYDGTSGVFRAAECRWDKVRIAFNSSTGDIGWITVVFYA